jgi:hypothetical protein
MQYTVCGVMPIAQAAVVSPGYRLFDHTTSLINRTGSLHGRSLCSPQHQVIIGCCTWGNAHGDILVDALCVPCWHSVTMPHFSYG